MKTITRTKYLKDYFENINIICIDFMDLIYEEIREYHALHAYVEEHYQDEKMNYLFVDEVQMCPKFEFPSARFNPPPLGGQALAAFPSRRNCGKIQH